MGRFGLAFSAFFRILKDQSIADQVRKLIDGKTLSEQISAGAGLKSAPASGVPTSSSAPISAQVSGPSSPIAMKPEPSRSEALNLLAVLQREARLIDFLQEPIAAYSDAQIGAAVRDVHRASAAVIARAFALKPVMESAEGSAVDVPAGADTGRVRLVGNVSATANARGTLRHAGWEATKVELPQWSGSAQTSKIVAPAEVEV